jgi:hypothetical protein
MEVFGTPVHVSILSLQNDVDLADYIRESSSTSIFFSPGSRVKSKCLGISMLALSGPHMGTKSRVGPSPRPDLPGSCAVR